MAALRQKQAFEGELNRIAGTRLTLEAQVRTLLPSPTRACPVVDIARMLILRMIAGERDRDGQLECRDDDCDEEGC